MRELINIVIRTSVLSELSVCFISNICRMYTYLYKVHNKCKDPLSSASFLLSIDEQKGYMALVVELT